MFRTNAVITSLKVQSSLFTKIKYFYVGYLSPFIHTHFEQSAGL